MSIRVPTAFLRPAVLAALALVALPALAQDKPEPATGGPAAPPAPGAAPESGAPDLDALESRIADLWSRVGTEKPTITPGETDPKRIAEYAKAAKSWEDSLGLLSAAADFYAKAGGQTPRTLYWCGSAKARRADRLSKDEVGPERRAAADMLTRALAAAPKDADYRPDAEYWLGLTSLHLVETGGSTPQTAAAHLRTAALAFLKANRNDDAGRATADAMKKLVALRLEGEARDFAAAVDAAGADFGRHTDTVRTLARRAATAVGERFPDLADVEDADGKPIRWKEFKGAPLLVHFFHAGWPTGRASDERDVETVLRPLWDRLGSKGLRIVGVSMDQALSKDAVERIRNNWDEWGTKGRLHDGSRASVRSYAEEQGIAWPWHCDGLWTKNPVSLGLGGVGASAAHAILVDRDGTIRWRGDAPFQGLPEAVDAAMK